MKIWTFLLRARNLNELFGRSRDYLYSRFAPNDHCNDQMLYEFRVNSVQGGAPGQFVPFRAVALGVSKISMQ